MYMKYKKLALALARSETSVEFFQKIFECVTLDFRNGTEVRNGMVCRVVFFSQGFNPPLAKVILQSPTSQTHFGSVRELRIVATKINRQLATEFKRLNPDMRVIWVSLDEWLARPKESPDPVTLSDELRVNSESIF